MSEWHKVEPRKYHICDGCEAGYCSISQKEINGELWSKTDDCHETCERYKEYATITNADRERMKIYPPVPVVPLNE